MTSDLDSNPMARYAQREQLVRAVVRYAAAATPAALCSALESLIPLWSTLAPVQTVAWLRACHPLRANLPPYSAALRAARAALAAHDCAALLDGLD